MGSAFCPARGWKLEYVSVPDRLSAMCPSLADILDGHHPRY